MNSAKTHDHINADRYTQVPSELTEKPQWLCYQNEVREGKKSKVPYNARTGGRGKTNDPSTLSEFDCAVASSENFHGIGYAFTEGDGIVGIDVDHPFDSPRAVETIERFSGTYCEKSPNGNLRIFVKGKAIRCGKGTVDKKVEVYDYTSPRYLTVTGQHIEGTSKQVTEQPEALEWLHGKYFASNDKYEPPAFNRVTNPVSDEIIINQASAASKGGKFDSLMQGKWEYIESEGRREYESQSEAEMALCNLIALQTSDPEQIDRIFRSSGLYREKWDKSHFATGETYGQRTISKALSYVQQQFEHIVPVEGFRLLTASDLIALPSLSWRIKGVLPDQGLAAIYGPPGSGKSFVVIDMAIAIASGTPWFEHRVQVANVLYVGLEGEGGVANRVKAYQIENRALPDSIRFLIQSFDLRNKDSVDQLAKSIIEEQGKGGVVFIDTLNRAAPGIDENSSQDMGQTINGAKRLQQKIKGLVVLIHHTGKDSGKGLRGHSSLNAALDAAIEVKRSTDDRSWKVMKSKDGEDGSEYGFSLKVIEIGKDDDGDLITSCVINPSDMTDRPREPNGKVQKHVFQTVRSLQKALNQRIPVETVIDMAIRTMPHDGKKDRRRDSALRALNNLVPNYLQMLDNMVW